MADAMDAVQNRFDTLQQNIEQFIETMRQIGIMVSDFQPGSQDVLNDKMYASLIRKRADFKKYSLACASSLYLIW